MMVYSSAPITIDIAEREFSAGSIGSPSRVEVEFSSVGDVSDCLSDEVVFSDSEELAEFCCDVAFDAVADSVMNGFING
jgi:hypothetical protein